MRIAIKNIQGKMFQPAPTHQGRQRNTGPSAEKPADVEKPADARPARQVATPQLGAGEVPHVSGQTPVPSPEKKKLRIDHGDQAGKESEQEVDPTEMDVSDVQTIPADLGEDSHDVVGVSPAVGQPGSGSAPAAPSPAPPVQVVEPEKVPDPAGSQATETPMASLVEVPSPELAKPVTPGDSKDAVATVDKVEGEQQIVSPKNLESLFEKAAEPSTPPASHPKPGKVVFGLYLTDL